MGKGCEAMIGGPKHQFVLMCSPPDVEKRFRNMRTGAELTRGKGKGSIFAFHGSAIGNWHCILRSGLKNMSNTAYMTSGAAHGAGIYMACDSATSLAYCRRTNGCCWSKSMFGSNFNVMALCEVINHKNLPKPNPYHVIKNESWVCTRYLFVIGKYSTMGSVKAMDLKPGANDPLRSFNS